jgi:hypothetical protein
MKRLSLVQARLSIVAEMASHWPFATYQASVRRWWRLSATGSLAASASKSTVNSID